MIRYRIKCADEALMALHRKKGKKTIKIKPKTYQLKCDYPYLTTKNYAFSTHAVYKKQRQIRENLQRAEDVIAKELGPTPMATKSDYSKRIKLYIRRKQR